MLLDTGEEIIAVEVDGRDAEISAALKYERDDPWDDLYSWIQPRRMASGAGLLELRINAICRPYAEQHYVMRLLPRWPELETDDPRCPARLAPGARSAPALRALARA